MMKTIITTIIAIAFSIQGNSEIVYSAQSGSWEQAITWKTGKVPTVGDIIVINNAHSVAITTNNTSLSGGSVDIIISGGLVFASSGNKLHLGCNSSISVSGAGYIIGYGGGGASNQITVCSQEVWKKSNGKAVAPFTIGTAVVLPVEMLSVHVSRSENANNLTWTTASETNNGGFLIKRSTDGITFTTIANIKGALNSSTIIDYTYTDISGVETSYYTIVQYDLNGETTEYGPYRVESTEEVKLSIYPNPSTDIVNITSDNIGITNVVIFDVTAKQISMSVNNISNGNQINVSDLIPGTYFIQVELENGSVEMKQFVVGK